MPKKQPILYDWDSLRYETYPNGDNLSEFNRFVINDDGTWTETTSTEGGTVQTVETGRLTQKELKQIDALADQINRDPYSPTEVMQFPQDDPSGSEFSSLELFNDGSQRIVHVDDSRSDFERDNYWGNDTADVQEANALEAAVQILDARYGDNFA
jgi:hypothetical protein